MRTPPAAISATPIHLPDSLLEPAGQLSRAQDTPLPTGDTDPTTWVAAGYLLGGVTCLAALAIQWAASRGYTPPNIIFSLFHRWGPVALVIPAAGGFWLHRSRLARALTIATLTLMAWPSAADRLGLSWNDGWWLKALLGGTLVLGGLVLGWNALRRTWPGRISA